MFLWMKRQFVGELFRAVDGSPRATVLIDHAHNQQVWSPSHGDTLTPAGYRNLFETAVPRVFGESKLFADVVHGIDAGSDARRRPRRALDAEAALTLIASQVDGVFAKHPLGIPPAVGGEWRVNPLYSVAREGAQLHGRLRFPSEDYEYEYSACREYLPDEVFVDRRCVRRAAGWQSPVGVRGSDSAPGDRRAAQQRNVGSTCRICARSRRTLGRS